MKTIIIFLAFLAVILTSAPAHSESYGMGQTLTVTATATVVSKEMFAVTQDEFEAGYDVHSVMWESKQCCLQWRSVHGMFSEYCHTPEMAQRLTDSVCDAHLKTTGVLYGSLTD